MFNVLFLMFFSAGIQPIPLCMPAKHSVTELYPQPFLTHKIYFYIRHDEKQNSLSYSAAVFIVGSDLWDFVSLCVFVIFGNISLRNYICGNFMRPKLKMHFFRENLHFCFCLLNIL